MKDQIRLARYVILTIAIYAITVAAISVFACTFNNLIFLALIPATAIEIYWLHRTIDGLIFHLRELERTRKLFEKKVYKSVLYEMRATPCGKIESDILAKEFDVDI